MDLAYLLAESGLMGIVFLLAVLVMALCMVAMAVGLILRNKTFTAPSGPITAISAVG